MIILSTCAENHFLLSIPLEIEPTHIIDTFINSVILYDEKVIIYYNIKDGRQASYIEMIEAPSEIENLIPLSAAAVNKKISARTKKCSNADQLGGA